MMGGLIVINGLPYPKLIECGSGDATRKHRRVVGEGIVLLCLHIQKQQQEKSSRDTPEQLYRYGHKR